MMLRELLFLCIIGNAICDERNWWKFTEIYEVYIWSFKDSNGDGIGDLKGITMKLDYLKTLQIGAIWISPFFDSPKSDMGYDIRDYTKVDPVFGTMADFEELSKEAAKRGIKIFIDFVINHSSDEHIWFKKSIEKIKPYDDYYVWKDAERYDKNNRPIPPNNWLSLFEGSMWEWNNKRKQFYLHQFGKKQPDFNLRNENVIQELKNILEFWYSKGVSGVRLDAASNFVEDSQFRDEPLLNPQIKKKKYTKDDYSTIYTQDLPESYEVIRKLRMFADKVNRERGGYERVFIAEVYANLNATIGYYGTEQYPIAQYPINFELALTRSYLTPAKLHNFITEWLKNIPKHGVSAWNAENHDICRVIGSRFVKEYSPIINTIIMMLPGVPVIYYGQEICMVNGFVRPDQANDTVSNSKPSGPETRDIGRTPMQWDSTRNAGFTSAVKAWLPVNPNSWNLNVESQKSNDKSCLNMFKMLSNLRKTKTCKYGAFSDYQLSTWVYAFTRTLEKYETYVVVFNLGTEYEIINLHDQIPNLKTFLKVIVASENSGYKKSDIIKAKSKFPNLFVMRPLSVLVLSSPNDQNKYISEYMES